MRRNYKSVGSRINSNIKNLKHKKLMPVRGSDDQERGDFEGGDQDDGDVLHGELGSGIS